MEPITLRVSTGGTPVTVRGDRAYIVGRGREVDIVVSGGKVSRRHVALEPGPAGWTVRDISANGMWHEGRRVTTVAVTGGWEPVVIRLGAVDGPEVSLLAPEPPAQPARSWAAEPDLSAEQTQIAPGARGGSADAGAPGRAGGPARKRRRRWFGILPTLLWLVATGFAIGALIAVS